MSAGYEIVGEIDIPDRLNNKAQAIILYHGLTNNRRDCPLINEVAEALVAEEFIVYRFDLYGSGESSGDMQDKNMCILEANAKDIVNYVSKDSRVLDIGLWGRSLGGSLVCLLPYNERIKARVVASPGVMFEDVMCKKFENLKKKELDYEKEGKRLPGTGMYKGPFELKQAFFESIKGFDNRVINNLKSLDTVLVLGTALDQKVTPENSCIVMNESNNPKRIMIYMTDHDFKGFETEAVKESVEWFKKYLK